MTSVTNDKCVGLLRSGLLFLLFLFLPLLSLTKWLFFFNWAASVIWNHMQAESFYFEVNAKEFHGWNSTSSNRSAKEQCSLLMTCVEGGEGMPFIKYAIAYKCMKKWFCFLQKGSSKTFWFFPSFFFSFKGKQVQIRKPAQSAPDVVPERKRSTPINPANTIRKCLSNNPVFQRPFRDRIIHLLALRSYKKLEVLARLQRDGINQKDRNSLGSTLQQVLQTIINLECPLLANSLDLTLWV